MITYKNISFCAHIFNTTARLAHKMVEFRVTKSELTIKIVTFFTLNLPCQNKSTLIRKFYDFLTAKKSVLTIYFGRWNSFEHLVKSVKYGETFFTLYITRDYTGWITKILKLSQRHEIFCPWVIFVVDFENSLKIDKNFQKLTKLTKNFFKFLSLIYSLFFRLSTWMVHKHNIT